MNEKKVKPVYLPDRLTFPESEVAKLRERSGGKTFEEFVRVRHSLS